ncbi:DUF3575 domain-containing protein [Crocinitomicaceae bacterium]|nr:DUF3575 domain-containing protein [Crocinitomicaceae bacterium]
MNLTKPLCLLFLLFMTSASFAQNEVMVIDRKNYKKNRSRDIRLNENTQIVKFAPLNLLAGEINFGYERQISQKSSLDLEIGPTLSNLRTGLNNHLIDLFEPVTIASSALGFLIGASYRYYPLDETEALNRFYVGPVLKYKLMNSRYEDISNILPDSPRGSFSRLNFYFNFGYQFWLSKSFALDVFGGLGIGYHSQTTYVSVFNFIDDQWQNSWQERNQSGGILVGNVGLKLGIGSK